MSDRAPVHEATGELMRGVFHDFRNHLTMLLTGTGTMRARWPGMAAGGADPDAVETLADMETCIRQVVDLIGALEAVACAGDSDVRQDVEEIVQRAIRLATPTVKSKAFVAAETRPGLVRNRGGAVEAALALMLVDLADRPLPVAAASPDHRSRRSLRVVVRQASGATLIEIHGPSAAMDEGGRRLRMAQNLVAQAGASLAIAPDPGASLRFTIALGP